MLRLLFSASAVFHSAAHGAEDYATGGALSDTTFTATVSAHAAPGAHARAVPQLPRPLTTPEPLSPPGALDEAQALLAATLADAEALLSEAAPTRGAQVRRSPVEANSALHSGSTADEDSQMLSSYESSVHEDGSDSLERLEELQRQLDEELFDLGALQAQLQHAEEVLSRAHAQQLAAEARHGEEIARRRARSRTWAIAIVAAVAACAHAPKTLQLSLALWSAIVQLTPLSIRGRIRGRLMELKGASRRRSTSRLRTLLHTC
jgi:hypothetical protein